jgi:hypothetical protein
MITLLLRLLRLLPFLCGHRQLALENLALHHQLAVYKRTVTRPKLRTIDRVFWVCLARVWAGWRRLPNYGDVSPGNRVPFATAAEAEAAGYRLAKNCP